MDAVITPSSALRGSPAIPADKAICHRAALLCTLVDGVTEIAPWSTAEDCTHTLDLVQQLGARVSRRPDAVRIRGVGLHGLRPSRGTLFCGDSGTTMRLACGLLAGQSFSSRLTAGPSLRQRPMRRIVEPLSRMGAQVRGARGPSPRELYPPLTVRGCHPLQGLAYRLPVASAQVKSAVLIAGLFADRPTTIQEPSPTRDHTERLLRDLGVGLQRRGDRVRVVPPRQALRAPGRLSIPADVSSAAFFVVAASLLPGSSLRLRGVGRNPTRTYFLRILRRMGADIRWTEPQPGWEPRGTLIATFRPLRGTRIRTSEVPLVIDELPILMVAACAAEGRTIFEGLGELRVKESDRLRAMVDGLRALGARVTRRGAAGLQIDASRLHGGVVESFGDHRIAMSLAIAGLAADGPTRIRGVGCVAKSFGSFFDVLRRLAGSAVVKTVDRP